MIALTDYLPLMTPGSLSFVVTCFLGCLPHEQEGESLMYKLHLEVLSENDTLPLKESRTCDTESTTLDIDSVSWLAILSEPPLAGG